MEWIALKEDAKNFPLTERILEFYKKEPIFFDDERELKKFSPKKGMILFRKKGSFIKKARYSKNAYHIFYAQNCSLGCCYCFLRTYFRSPFLKLAVNKEDALKEVQSIKEKIILHALDFSEPLLFEEATGYIQDIAENLPENVSFEVRTKMAEISPLLNIRAKENIILSWTILPSILIKKLEAHTASFIERLEAAKICHEKGFKIAFHFDPIVYTQDFKLLYKACINKLSSIFPYPIHYITLGTLRVEPSLYKLLLNEGKDVFLFEFVKKRNTLSYPAPLRMKIYRFIIHQIIHGLSVKNIFLCDEEEWIYKALKEELDDVSLMLL